MRGYINTVGRLAVCALGLGGWDWIGPGAETGLFQLASAAAQETGAATAVAPPPGALATDIVAITMPRQGVEIAERFSKVLQFEHKLLRVDGFDPAVVTVTPLAPNQLRIQALEQGVTTLVATDEHNQAHAVELFIVGDARLLQSVLKRTYPNTAVQAIKVRDSVLLRGWVSEPQQISEIVALSELYFPRVLNQMKVGGPQEVQLRVQVMEVQRSQIRRFGVNFKVMGDNAAFVSSPGPISPLATMTLPFGGPPVANFADSGLQNASMALGIATDNFVFQGLVQALKQEGLLKIQAEPVLVTRSGEAAKLINGGEFPIPVPQSLGTVTIEWREFGVTLESLPIVLSPTTLKQTIVAEVSERDFTTAVTLNGTTVPGLTKRTVQTQAVMEFGQTLVIGGLISTRYTAQTDKIPFLGELPGLGAAFRRVRYDTAETELLVMITPEYVTALSPEQVLPGGVGKFTAVPTDRELYGAGFIEVPNYGDPCKGPNCQPQGMPNGPIPQGPPGYAPSTGYVPPPPSQPAGLAPAPSASSPGMLPPSAYPPGPLGPLTPPATGFPADSGEPTLIGPSTGPGPTGLSNPTGLNSSPGFNPAVNGTGAVPSGPLDSNSVPGGTAFPAGNGPADNSPLGNGPVNAPVPPPPGSDPSVSARPSHWMNDPAVRPASGTLTPGTNYRQPPASTTGPGGTSGMSRRPAPRPASAPMGTRSPWESNAGVVPANAVRDDGIEGLIEPQRGRLP